MSDFLGRLEAELVAAGRRRASARRPRAWARRTLLVAAIALVAAVPVSAVTGVWDESPPEPAGDGGGVVPDLGEGPCRAPAPALPPVAEGPPPAALVDLLGVLRRPAMARDRLAPASLPLVAGVHRDAVRLAREDADGTRAFVVPAENIRYAPPVPDTPECERFRRARPRPQAGVCLVVQRRGRGAGVGCSTASQIRAGFSQLAEDHIAGERPGTAHVAGIVPDGVTRVVLEFPRGPQRRVEADVRGNVYLATYNGSAAARPRTFWQTESGTREVARLPEPTPRARRAARRSRARDRAATTAPSVFPRRGAPETIFTLRLRGTAPAYVVTLRGPGGDGCADRAIERTGAVAGRGGLVRLSLTARTLGRERWCPGSYRGEVFAEPQGPAGLDAERRRRRVGSFGFTVNQR